MLNTSQVGKVFEGSIAHFRGDHLVHLVEADDGVLGIAADVDHFARVQQFWGEHLERQVRLDDPRLVGRQIIGKCDGVLEEWSRGTSVKVLVSTETPDLQERNPFIASFILDGLQVDVVYNLPHNFLCPL